MLRLAFLILYLPLLVSCDPFAEPETAPLEEGQALEATHYGTQPQNRRAYTELATLIIPGRIAFIRPAATPELIKTISIPGLISYFAQIDRDGYVWLAAPDGTDRIPRRHVYVVDPHTETIHKAIPLPEALRAPAGLAFYEDRVYVRAWRDGLSAGLGAIDREDLSVRVITELENTGTGYLPDLYLAGDTLFMFSTRAHPDGIPNIHQFSTRTDDLTRTVPYASPYTMDGRSVFTVGYFEPGVNTLYKLDRDTLEPLESVVLSWEGSLLAQRDSLLYVAYYQSPTIEVRSKETLERIGTIDISGLDVSGGQYVHNNFGFITEEVLMLNESSFYNVSTGERLSKLFPFDEMVAQNLVLAEGKTLQSFGN